MLELQHFLLKRKKKLCFVKVTLPNHNMSYKIVVRLTNRRVTRKGAFFLFFLG